MTTRILIASLLLIAAGCHDRPVGTALPTPDPAPEMARIAYITVSEPNPAVGSTVIIAGNIGASDSMKVGSFRLRLTHPAGALQYEGEVDVPGVVRVVNAQSTDAIVAGAAAGDLEGDRLFALRFKVLRAGVMDSVGLAIDELNDVHFASRMASVRKWTGLRVDPALAARGTK